MVSGFKTSPLEDARIVSGEANPIEILLNFFVLFISINEIIFYSSNLISNPNPLSSCIKTLKDSGKPASGILSPLTIAS